MYSFVFFSQSCTSKMSIQPTSSCTPQASACDCTPHINTTVLDAQWTSQSGHEAAGGRVEWEPAMLPQATVTQTMAAQLRIYVSSTAHATEGPRAWHWRTTTVPILFVTIRRSLVFPLLLLSSDASLEPTGPASGSKNGPAGLFAGPKLVQAGLGKG